MFGSEERRSLMISALAGADSWEYPVQTGSVLAIAQVYAISVEDGTAVIG